MGFWTDGRTHGHNFEKCVYQNPLPRTKSKKNGVGKNSRAFCLARTESIPAVLTVVNFTKKQNALTGGSGFFVVSPFCHTKSTDLEAKTVTIMECLFLQSIIFGEAKSTDSRAMGFWTDARTHGHIFEKCVFQISFHGRNQKNGVGKNSRAFCLARTESIPAVLIVVNFTKKGKRFDRR